MENEKQKKYIVFTCPHCGGHELKRVDIVSFEMNACLDGASGTLYGSGNSTKETERRITYKCASCDKPLTENEIYENSVRTPTPQNAPYIAIDYKLYTDGDYRLDNCKKWGARWVDDDVDYIGHVEFSGDGMKTLAVHFLWSMLCEKDGLRIGTGHHWLLRDFYDIFEGLAAKIYKLDCKNRKACGELSGNQEGTEFIVTLHGDIPEE